MIEELSLSSANTWAMRSWSSNLRAVCLSSSSVRCEVVIRTDSSCSSPSGQVVCEGCVAVHGAGSAAALQLREPPVLSGERDGVLAPERVLLQTPALPGATRPHGHHGQPGPVPPDVSPGVRDARSQVIVRDMKEGCTIYNRLISVSLCYWLMSNYEIKWIW